MNAPLLLINLISCRYIFVFILYVNFNLFSSFLFACLQNMVEPAMVIHNFNSTYLHVTPFYVLTSTNHCTMRVTTMLCR